MTEAHNNHSSISNTTTLHMSPHHYQNQPELNISDNGTGNDLKFIIIISWTLKSIYNFKYKFFSLMTNFLLLSKGNVNSWLMDLSYHTSPDIPGWAWISISVMFATIGAFGIFSNLIIIVAYVKTKTVRC